jgi:tellurite resistance protein TehA-like permease
MPTNFLLLIKKIMSFQIEDMPPKTKLAAGLFGFAFILKFLALALGFTHLRWLGYILFALAFGCIFLSIILCLLQLRNQEKPPSKAEVEKWMKYYSLNKES